MTCSIILLIDDFYIQGTKGRKSYHLVVVEGSVTENNPVEIGSLLLVILLQQRGEDKNNLGKEEICNHNVGSSSKGR
jgi:hypothetical protein